MCSRRSLREALQTHNVSDRSASLPTRPSSVVEASSSVLKDLSSVSTEGWPAEGGRRETS
jgi:hypothetical protein